MEMLLYLSEPIWTVGILLIILTAVAMGLRLFTRKLNNSHLGFDDLFLLLAILCYYAENIIQLYCLHLAQEIDSPLDSTFIDYVKWIWISTTFAVPTLAFLKLSVIFFYRRMFITKRWFRITSIVLMVIVSLYGISGSLGEIFECNPPSYTWNLQTLAGTDKDSHCMPYNVYAAWLMSYVIVDTILDATILVLPVVMISQLQLPTWKRYSLIGIFLLGGFTVATNIIRLVFMDSNKANPEQVGMIDELWISIHCGCGIIASCLPTYGPLVSHFTTLASGIRRSSAERKVPESEGEQHAGNTQVSTGPAQSRSVRSSYIRMDDNEDGANVEEQFLDPREMVVPNRSPLRGITANPEDSAV